MSRFHSLLLTVFLSAGVAGGALAQTPQKPRNVVIFVADGLRYGIVNKDTAPTLYAIQQGGVDFRNSHSLYPTVTTVNASSIATGHGIGDTGEWSNSVYFSEETLDAANGKRAPGMENDLILKQANDRYAGNFLNEMSLLRMARDHGYQTAAIGKEGPTLIQDLTAADGKSTIIIDDATGMRGNTVRPVAVDAEIMAAIVTAGLSTDPKDHPSNGTMWSESKTGLKVANIAQQKWFTDVTTEVVLPRMVKTGQPFALVYWSRDPDGTQHNTGDSIDQYVPGINGPTSLAAVRNASDNLQVLIDKLKALGVYDNTDIFVTADHGFSTINKTAKGAWSSTFSYDDVPKGEMPDGFLGLDLAHALNLPLWDESGKAIDPATGNKAKGTLLIGADAKAWDIMTVDSGGSVLLYLNTKTAQAMAPKIADALTRLPYVAALFANDTLGAIPGTLPFSAVGLKGTALTPQPAIYVGFSDFVQPDCLKEWKIEELCSVMYVGGSLKQGQGSHGGFTRANTRNFMAAMGPDFKAGFVNMAPISNADIAPTFARILGFDLPSKGTLKGRVITEALKGGPTSATSTAQVTRSAPAANGFVTVLESQTVGDEVYLDAAGMPGRVVGLKSKLKSGKKAR